MKHYQTKIKGAEYKVVLELYYLYKAETKKEARLPLNDYRRTPAKHKGAETTSLAKRIPLQIITLKNFLTRVAALW